MIENIKLSLGHGISPMIDDSESHRKWVKEYKKELMNQMIKDGPSSQNNSNSQTSDSKLTVKIVQRGDLAMRDETNKSGLSEEWVKEYKQSIINGMIKAD